MNLVLVLCCALIALTGTASALPLPLHLQAPKIMMRHGTISQSHASGGVVMGKTRATATAVNGVVSIYTNVAGPSSKYG
jgi:hypothetical protein